MPSHNPGYIKGPLRPWHYQAILLSIQGHSYAKIGRVLQKSADAVKLVMVSDAAKELLASINDCSVETIREVRAYAQINAPAVFVRMVQDALAGNTSAQRFVLEVAGHTAQQKILVEHKDVDSEFEGLTEEQMRERLLAKIHDIKGSGGQLLS